MKINYIILINFILVFIFTPLQAESLSKQGIAFGYSPNAEAPHLEKKADGYHLGYINENKNEARGLKMKRGASDVERLNYSVTHSL